jgi:autophagy-related protein 9
MDRVREAAAMKRICIRKKNLTELDIYNVILRQRNYLVAVLDILVLKSSYQLPFVGSMVFMSSAQAFYMGLLLFGQKSPFMSCSSFEMYETTA